jgi:hypothetical protein
MKPSIGRIVHYTNLGDRDGKYPPEVQAAIITRVLGPGDGAGDADAVSLHIFYPTGQFDMPTVPKAADNVVAGSEAARGKWQWPTQK